MKYVPKLAIRTSEQPSTVFIVNIGDNSLLFLGILPLTLKIGMFAGSHSINLQTLK